MTQNKKNIEMNENEFRILTKMVYFATLFMNENEDAPEINEYEKIANYIYSLAPQFNATDLINQDPKTNRHFPTEKFEQEMLPFVERFQESFFWDELIYRLADRDLRKQKGDNVVEHMTEEERLNLTQPFIDKYYEEFTQNGLDNLNL